MEGLTKRLSEIRLTNVIEAGSHISGERDPPRNRSIDLSTISTASLSWRGGKTRYLKLTAACQTKANNINKTGMIGSTSTIGSNGAYASGNLATNRFIFDLQKNRPSCSRGAGAESTMISSFPFFPLLGEKARPSTKPTEEWAEERSGWLSAIDESSFAGGGVSFFFRDSLLESSLQERESGEG